MKLREWKEHLDKLVKEHPEALDLDLVYSGDDEGNSYQHVYYGPGMGRFESEGGRDGEFKGLDLGSKTPEEDCVVNRLDDCNAICIN